ncbi:MAG: N-acetyltransferase [Acholeplasmatales bacterium]|nr:MAG: N-acetyltransferase [Acholeplasmatales bacterium]
MTIKTGIRAFYVGENQQEPDAIITYTEENDTTIVANSTYVDPSLRGQQVAKKLLDRLVEHAREHGLKIRPTCSYVVKMFERDKRFADVALMD